MDCFICGTVMEIFREIERGLHLKACYKCPSCKHQSTKNIKKLIKIKW